MGRRSAAAIGFVPLILLNGKKRRCTRSAVISVRCIVIAVSPKVLALKPAKDRTAGRSAWRRARLTTATAGHCAFTKK
jgi:hypothetical protein